MILAFALAFEIPFLMVMAARAGFVSSAYFKQKRAWFYLAICLLSFLLAAGEMTATVLLALPLFLLYESGIFISSLFAKKK
jgi:sec-independent protein translocase protein TatC